MPMMRRGCTDGFDPQVSVEDRVKSRQDAHRATIRMPTGWRQKGMAAFISNVKYLNDQPLAFLSHAAGLNGAPADTAPLRNFQGGVQEKVQHGLFATVSDYGIKIVEANWQASRSHGRGERRLSPRKAWPQPWLPGRQPDQMGQRHSLRPVRPRSRPGPLRNGSLCCISTRMWALPCVLGVSPSG